MMDPAVGDRMPYYDIASDGFLTGSVVAVHDGWMVLLRDEPQPAYRGPFFTMKIPESKPS